MRTLVVTEFLSLDGVVDSPGGGEHPRAGWTFKEVPFEAAAYAIKGREQEESGALLMGRRSYQEFAPVWGSMAEFEHYNALPKYVVSTTLDETDPAWPATILRDVHDVAALKAEDGEGTIIVHGSPTLVQGLLAADLVDRFHLLLFPLVLGTGRRLFADQAVFARLSLTEQEAFANGVVGLVYDVAR